MTLRKSGLTLMCAVALCGGMATSCLDEINGRLDNLEQRVSDLEESLTGQIDALKQLVDGRTAITSWKFDDKTGIYEFVLSDGKTVSLAKGVDAASFIGVAQDESGAYYWTLGGEPLLNAANEKIYLESKVSPSVRVNPDTNEWEISPDGGKTYLQTGLKAGDSAYLITSVTEDDSYVYFTLSDGSKIQVKKEVDSAIAMLAGKQYFAAGQTKTIKLQLEGVKKTAVFSKPDGWKASVASDALSVTAPAADNANAETTGSVIVQAWFDDGTSDIAEVKVEVGEAPHEITVDAAFNITIGTSQELKDNYDNWGNWGGYATGVSLLADFSEEMITSSVGDRTQWHWPDDTDYTLEGMLGSAPVKGESYVVWVLDKYDDYGEISYSDILYTVIVIPDLKIEATNITFEDATIVVTPKGVNSYYAGMYNIADGNSIDYYLEGINDYNEGELYNSAFNGSLTKYGASSWQDNEVKAGATYCVYAIPYVAGKKYTAEDVISIEVKINAITTGGTASVTIGDVKTTMTSIEATVTKGAGVYKYYVQYMSDEEIAQYADDEALFQYLITRQGYTDDTYTLKPWSKIDPDTKGWIVAVAIDKDGKAGPVVRKEANTLPVSFISTTLPEPTVNVDLKEVTVTIPATAGIKAYRYIDITETQWNVHYVLKGDPATTEKNLATSDSFYGSYHRDEANADGSITIKLTDRSAGQNYKLFVEGEDAEGGITKMITVEYTPSISSDKFIASDNAKWKAADISEITINGIEVSNASKKEQLYTEIKGELFTKNATLACKVTRPDNCAKCWYIVGDGNDLIVGLNDRLKTSSLLTSYNTYELGDDNTISYGWFNASSDLYIVWQDTDGNYYSYKAYGILGMMKE